ncbi:MAG: sodium:proton antiporter [Firmicutes bacterium]|nr:sodium:proton antiporter [Bacillota bacterium]MBQ6899297.1 sodium:proton antiporter [Bacillota bacterium]
MEILFNPIVIAVLLLIVLCVMKINVLLSLLISALAAGLLAGMDITEIMNVLIGGMGGNAQTALSYILLGILASGMAYTGITEILSQKISKVVGKNGLMLIAALAVIACCSQNLIPVHIAFIPILVPSLLPLMNELKLDRRNAACALAFGLKAPYIALPFGFGFIFHGLIADNLNANGMNVEVGNVWKSTWMLGAAMLLGLVAAIIIFRRPRTYETRAVAETASELKMNISHWVTLAAAVGTLVINLRTDSLPLGALTGIAIMVIFGAVKVKDLESVVKNGFGIMGVIAFIMLVASGYAAVMNETGAVDQLVEASVAFMGTSKIFAATIMMVIGLIITMGIGTSFGTIPVLAVLYVPLCAQIGFSTEGTIMLIAAAAALGDAGSPASDTTLGPTSGLNADGQHDHIWDTCIPTAICYNVPLALCAILVAPLL